MSNAKRDPKKDPRKGDMTLIAGVFENLVDDRYGDMIYVLNSRVGSVRPPYRTGVTLASWQQSNRKAEVLHAAD